MTTDAIDALAALLAETEEAHGRYQTDELNGVYDEQWARWYAAYAVDHGLADLLGHPVTTDQLAEFLAMSFTAFKQAGPEPAGSWAVYAARRITGEL